MICVGSASASSNAGSAQKVDNGTRASIEARVRTGGTGFGHSRSKEDPERRPRKHCNLRGLDGGAGVQRFLP